MLTPDGIYASGINRNILECKVTIGILDSSASIVLIETYWNVKMDDLFLDTYYFFVLIGTDWNVNVNEHHNTLCQFRVY